MSCSKYDDEKAEVKHKESIESTAKVANIEVKDISKRVEIGIQTERQCYTDQYENFKEFLTSLRLPKVFQQKEQRCESDDEIALMTVEFVKKFGLIMINDKKIYDFMRSDHEDFLNEALKLAPKCFQLKTT